MTKSWVRLSAVVLTTVAAHSWSITVDTVHNFPANGSQGTKPFATLTIGPDRSLYGTTTESGANNAGTAFKYTPELGLTHLDDFDAVTTGKSSEAQLITIGDGFLYGATSQGTGTAGAPIGTVFKLDPAGGANALTPIFAIPGFGSDPQKPMSLTSGEPNVLHVLGSSPGGIWRVPLDGVTSPTVPFKFTTTEQGIFPWRIMRASDGNLYGVTVGTGFVGTDPGYRGTIFRLGPNGSGFTKLHDCLSPTGVAPKGQLVEDGDGILYGAMSSGGANLDGVIYKITKDGSYTPLLQMNDNAPTGDLLIASDGKLYGTCSNSGNQLYGSVFRLNRDGSGFQVIHNFTRTNGAYPKGGLVQADDGKLYGTTLEGGAEDKGTIYRIDLGLPTPPVNRAPVAVTDYGFSSGSATGVNVLANDFDPNEDPTTADIEEPLTLTIETQPVHGAASIENGVITYSPAPGQYDGSDEFTYRITDPDGLFDIGTVYITNEQPPQPFQAGVYNGIVNLDPTLSGDFSTPRGQLVLNISSTGFFTGKLFAQGKRMPVRGVIDADGTGFALVKVPKKGTGIMYLFNGDGLSVYFFGHETWTGVVAPLPVNLPPAAKYTAILPNTSVGMPLGNGYGVARSFSNGLVAVVGKMGDGTKLSWGTTFVSFGSNFAIPVYGTPVKGGVCAGYLGIGAGDPFFQGNLRWIRPAAAKPTQPYPNGFAGNVACFMGLYTPPSPGSSPLDFGADQKCYVQLSGETIPATGGFVVFNGKKNVPEEVDGNPVKSLTINKATGLYSGKMSVNGKTISFKGAVLQPILRGVGHYTIDKVTGAADIIGE